MLSEWIGSDQTPLLLKIYDYLVREGNVAEDAENIIKSIVLGRKHDSLDLGALHHRGVMILMRALVYAFPGYRATIPYWVGASLNARESDLSESPVIGRHEDMAVITGLMATLSDAGNDTAEGLASFVNLDNSLQDVLIDALKQRHFQHSPGDSATSSHFSCAMKKWIDDAASRAVVSNTKWKRIERMIAIAYNFSLFPNGMDELKSKEIVEGSFEAKICDELFFKVSANYGRSARLSMLLGPNALDRALAAGRPEESTS